MKVLATFLALTLSSLISWKCLPSRTEALPGDNAIAFLRGWAASVAVHIQ